MIVVQYALSMIIFILAFLSYMDSQTDLAKFLLLVQIALWTMNIAVDVHKIREKIK